MQNNARSRRRPQQARSRDTVDAILTATARLLTKEGYARLSTNRVAVVAGVSVGSLYQYFSSKEELVEELLERRLGRQVEALRARLAALGDASIERVVRELVHAVLEERQLEQELYRALWPRVGAVDTRTRVSEVVELVRITFEGRRDRLRPDNLDLAAFLVVSVLEATADSAMVGRPDLLDDGVLAEELSALLIRYLVLPADEARRTQSSPRLRAVGA